MTTDALLAQLTLEDEEAPLMYGPDHDAVIARPERWAPRHGGTR
jgi:hypothetical protein